MSFNKNIGIGNGNKFGFAQQLSNQNQASGYTVRGSVSNNGRTSSTAK